MAYYPCDRGPHYNPGRNFLVYFAVGSGDDFVRKRLRYCGKHFDEITDSLLDQKVTPEVATARSYGRNSSCLVCQEPLDEAGLQLFVTTYPTKDQREDYWAGIHDTCSDAYWAAVESLNGATP